MSETSPSQYITLPAPVDPALSVTCDALGRFVSMAWQDDVDRAASDKAALIASTKAQMFTGDRLCLTSLIALHTAYERKENDLLSIAGDLEKSDAQTLAFKNAHKAQEQGDRVGAWIAAYPVQNASDLAQMTLTLVCGRKLASPMTHNERLSLRHAAANILALQGDAA